MQAVQAREPGLQRLALPLARRLEREERGEEVLEVGGPLPWLAAGDAAGVPP